jgi:hypothetical protein
LFSELYKLLKAFNTSLLPLKENIISILLAFSILSRKAKDGAFLISEKSDSKCNGSTNTFYLSE